VLTAGQAAQTLATVFDGITRYSRGVWFRRQAQADGFKAAVEWRDSGRPIPEGDEARAMIAEFERRLGEEDLR
jgi:enoyl-CoA hydratase